MVPCAMPALIRLERVSKDYREGGAPRAVLKDATASFEEGELVAIRGRSGSGKSTLLHLLAGIDLPTSGDVVVDGACLNRLSARDRTLFRRRHLGFVFQFFNLIPTLTVAENVRLPLALNEVSRGDAAVRSARVLGELEIAHCAERFPEELSGGEQQRVAIARAVAHEPALVL